MIRASCEDQIRADYCARKRSADGLHRATGRGVDGARHRPRAHHGGTSNVEGRQVEMIDAVAICYETTISKRG